MGFIDIAAIMQETQANFNNKGLTFTVKEYNDNGDGGMHDVSHTQTFNPTVSSSITGGTNVPSLPNKEWELIESVFRKTMEALSSTERNSEIWKFFNALVDAIKLIKADLGTHDAGITALSGISVVLAPSGAFPLSAGAVGIVGAFEDIKLKIDDMDTYITAAKIVKKD